jgi:hypothetical protein
MRAPTTAAQLSPVFDDSRTVIAALDEESCSFNKPSMASLTL